MATADDSKGRATGVAGDDFSPPEGGQELGYPEWLLALWWLRARGRRKSPTDRA